MAVLISPRLSIGSPITFMIRPRVASPTGTLITSFVASTSCPLLNPVVDLSASARTQLSPKCEHTSKKIVSLASSSLISNASYILGIIKLK